MWRLQHERYIFFLNNLLRKKPLGARGEAASRNYIVATILEVKVFKNMTLKYEGKTDNVAKDETFRIMRNSFKVR